MASMKCSLISTWSNDHVIQLPEFRSRGVKATTRSSFSVLCRKSDNPMHLEEEKSTISIGSNNNESNKRLRILVAGGGIRGLVLALAAKHRGFDVEVFEKADSTALRGEGRHRGSIQLSSSALAVLKAIDEDAAKKIMEEVCCVIGNKVNGFADGVSRAWLTKFDLSTPAMEKGLPITRVVCRMTLQDTLANAVGPHILKNKSKVADFIQEPNKVKVILEDGQQYEGDILVGADDIWPRVRSKMFGKQEASYSNFTCYSGLTEIAPDHIPETTSTVGYQAFLGCNQYFVLCDVGEGRMQWYAFIKEPPLTTLIKGNKKKRLLDVFGNWCDRVIAAISITEEEMIIERGIYDRDMIYKSWGIGRVTLLGDAAHPMQPNLGLGGCMAIEDCYHLILELGRVSENGFNVHMSDEIISALRRYEKKRMFRVGILHEVSRTASKMLSQYHSYIEFKVGPLSTVLSTLQITHPAIPVARAIMQLFSAPFMDWAITGHG
ncbi:zeaxanthin epoxidase, chloroplastic-like [Humulus lupulus]|uniref:zeaxanthin epoxidase, chloroplastic-like n=1 Tax=Humulus lupulus TaxID=3486 RepID=UPI002B412C22|nr:zeaxanthin epoxidase, chloroplastic-like [Humulus lupulus]